MAGLINIATEFSRKPGARYYTDGLHSGQEFREKWLDPRYCKAVQDGHKLTINLDGTNGFATSFLEESFGGLARIYGADSVLKTLDFISEEDDVLVDEILGYINDARTATVPTAVQGASGKNDIQPGHS